MKPLLLSLVGVAVLALGFVFAPPSSRAASTQGGGSNEPSTVIVQIKTRTRPDEMLVWAGLPKRRVFKLYCQECYLTQTNGYVPIVVDFKSGTTPNQLAQMFAKEIEQWMHVCLGYCNYSVEVVNNSLIITGVGADRFAGTWDDPVYDGETGSDLTDDGKPKSSPFCLIQVYKED